MKMSEKKYTPEDYQSVHCSKAYTYATHENNDPLKPREDGKLCKFEIRWTVLVRLACLLCLLCSKAHEDAKHGNDGALTPPGKRRTVQEIRRTSQFAWLVYFTPAPQEHCAKNSTGSYCAEKPPKSAFAPISGPHPTQNMYMCVNVCKCCVKCCKLKTMPQPVKICNCCEAN